MDISNIVNSTFLLMQANFTLAIKSVLTDSNSDRDSLLEVMNISSRMNYCLLAAEF